MGVDGGNLIPKGQQYLGDFFSQRRQRNYMRLVVVDILRITCIVDGICTVE